LITKDLHKGGSGEQIVSLGGSWNLSPGERAGVRAGVKSIPSVPRPAVKADNNPCWQGETRL
jgi:hypothetical protein